MSRTDDLMPHETTEALVRSAERMSDEARHAMRRRIVHEIRRDAHAHFFARTSRRVAAAMVGVSVLGGGVAYAASGATPGSALYPVKRATENVLVAILPPGALERSVLVGIAGRRAGEAAHLASEGAASELMGDAMSGLRDAVDQAVSSGGDLGISEIAEIEEQACDAPDQTRDAISEVVVPTEQNPAGSGTGVTDPATGTGGDQNPGNSGESTGGAGAQRGQ